MIRFNIELNMYGFFERLLKSKLLSFLHCSIETEVGYAGEQTVWDKSTRRK